MFFPLHGPVFAILHKILHALVSKMPKLINKKTLPIEGLSGAAFCATLLISLLIAVRYPLEEMAVTSGVLYLAVWMCGEGIFKLFVKVLDLLIAYGERVSEKLGIGMEEFPEQPPASTAFGTLVAIAVLLMLVGTVLGSALLLGNFAVEAFGLTPLSHVVLRLSGWVAVGSVVGLTSVLSLVAGIFLAADGLSEMGRAKFSLFRYTTREVGVKLRRSKLAPALP